MVKINMEINVAFEGMVEILKTLAVDHIDTEYSKEKEEACIVTVTDLQARAILKAYGNVKQFVCCGGVTAYYTGDNMVIQYSKNGTSRCYIISGLNTIGIVRDLEDSIKKVDAINTILGQ